MPAPTQARAGMAAIRSILQPTVTSLPALLGANMPTFRKGKKSIKENWDTKAVDKI